MTLRNDGLASDAVAVTPSDTSLDAFHGLYIGGAGDVTIKGSSGVAVTFTAVPAGSIIPIVCRVMATLTTATSIVGFVP